MATKMKDWSVTDVTRKAAGYSAKMEGGEVPLQLISFKLSYQGWAPEQLMDVPFPCGTTTEELVRWCAEDSVDTQGQARVPSQKQPIIHFGHHSMMQRLMDNGCLKPKSAPFRM